jgi:hypothetical protein
MEFAWSQQIRDMSAKPDEHACRMPGRQTDVLMCVMCEMLSEQKGFLSCFQDEFDKQKVS